MTAKDKTSPFSTQSDKGMRDEVISEPTALFEVKPDHAKELAAATSERFAAVLRTAPVEETVKTGLRDSRQARFSSGERLLWTTTFESEWHRYIDKPINPSTIH
jgi:hypothetical protein